MVLTAHSAWYLSIAEREEIALLNARGEGVRGIARSTGRSPSMITRELRRNAATCSGRLDYPALVAHWHAEGALDGPSTPRPSGSGSKVTSARWHHRRLRRTADPGTAVEDDTGE